MRDDPVVMALVERARLGEQAAWDQIVERYAPLVWSVCVRFGLTGADADDVGACVWLRLVERLGAIREPAALPGWLATTTRNECLRLLKGKKRQVPVETKHLPDETVAASDEWLLTEERRIALRIAFLTLSERCKALLSQLFADEPARYAQISNQLGIPVGGIGPTRLRCLDALRGHPLIAALGERPEYQPDGSAT
jgi:RNA polymerase sigma factor (sigma-70 family)